MKKSLLSLMVLAIMAVMFTGCTGGGDEASDFNPDPETFYIKDVEGVPISGIDYDCDNYYGTTDENGELRLGSAVTYCYITLTDVVSPIILYVGSNIAEGIRYECNPSGIIGETDQTGLLEFIEDDICIIHD